VRYGREVLGGQEGFFAQLVDVVVKTFGEAYPELVSAREKIFSIIAEEEASFSRTLVKGIERFKKLAASAQVRDPCRRRSAAAAAAAITSHHRSTLMRAWTAGGCWMVVQ
jgi:alanyl-tRNA synthetase